MTFSITSYCTECGDPLTAASEFNCPNCGEVVCRYCLERCGWCGQEMCTSCLIWDKEELEYFCCENCQEKFRTEDYLP